MDNMTHLASGATLSRAILRAAVSSFRIAVLVVEYTRDKTSNRNEPDERLHTRVIVQRQVLLLLEFCWWCFCRWYSHFMRTAAATTLGMPEMAIGGHAEDIVIRGV